MKIQWVSHLPKDKQEGFKKQIRSASDVLERLEQIVEDKLILKTFKPDYDSPSWAYSEADTNGYNRALTEIKALLKVKETIE